MHVTTRQTHKPRIDRGQGTLEFALIIPVVLVLLVSLMEVSRLVFFWAMVTTASREGVRTASTMRYHTDCTAIRNAALAAGELVGMTAGDVEIYYHHEIVPADDDVDPATYAYATCATLNPGDVVSEDLVRVVATAYYTPGGGFVPLAITPLTVQSDAYRTIAIGITIP